MVAIPIVSIVGERKKGQLKNRKWKHQRYSQFRGKSIVTFELTTSAFCFFYRHFNLSKSGSKETLFIKGSLEKSSFDRRLPSSPIALSLLLSLSLLYVGYHGMEIFWIVHHYQLRLECKAQIVLHEEVRRVRWGVCPFLSESWDIWIPGDYCFDPIPINCGDKRERRSLVHLRISGADRFPGFARDFPRSRLASRIASWFCSQFSSPR